MPLEPFRCVHCALPLPIEIVQSESAMSLECASCGARYRGRLWPEIPERFQRNARPIPPSDPSSHTKDD
jgi:hypothetical protein